jgi:hypothetical protein
LNILKTNNQNLKHFDKIIKEYSSFELDNLPFITSIASIKWLKPVRVKQLQLYMKKKLGWIESYTFIKVKKKYFLFILFFYSKGFSIINTFSNSVST